MPRQAPCACSQSVSIVDLEAVVNTLYEDVKTLNDGLRIELTFAGDRLAGFYDFLNLRYMAFWEVRTNAALLMAITESLYWTLQMVAISQPTLRKDVERTLGFVRKVSEEILHLVDSSAGLGSAKDIHELHEREDEAVQAIDRLAEGLVTQRSVIGKLVERAAKLSGTERPLIHLPTWERRRPDPFMSLFRNRITKMAASSPRVPRK